MLAQNLLPAGDNAFDDLRPAGARALNARIDTLPDAWWLSIPCCRTLPRLLTHDQKPDTASDAPLLWLFSTAISATARDGRATGCKNDGWSTRSPPAILAAQLHADFVPDRRQRGVCRCCRLSIPTIWRRSAA